MWMDLVELVIRIEEEFDVKICDQEAAMMETPRHLVDFLLAQPTVRSRFSPEKVSELVWQCIENELGVERAKFTDDSHFVNDMYSGSFFRF